MPQICISQTAMTAMRILCSWQLKHHKISFLTSRQNWCQGQSLFAYLGVLVWKGNSPQMTSLWKAKLWCITEDKPVPKTRNWGGFCHSSVFNKGHFWTYIYQLIIRCKSRQKTVESFTHMENQRCYLLILCFPLHLLAGCFLSLSPSSFLIQ